MSKYNNRHGALRKGNGVLYAIIFLLSGLLIVSFFIITGKTSNNHTLSKSSVIKTDKKDSLSSSDKSVQRQHLAVLKVKVNQIQKQKIIKEWAELMLLMIKTILTKSEMKF